MASLREGSKGSYYGSEWGSSEPLSESEMKVNAEYIYKYLNSNGWSKNAVAGLLGNMQAESSINPGRWQNDNVGATSNGYGLVQWTPSTNYTDWCASHGWSDPSEMDTNLLRIIYEVDNKLQWIATDSYNFSFEEFKTSTKSAGELAKAFLLNYERPADQSSSVQEYRASNGEAWYTYLGGVNVDDSESGSESIATKKKKFNFILFNRRYSWKNKNFSIR